MGLVNSSTSVFQKLDGVDKQLLHQLVLEGNDADFNINNACALSMKRNGMKLNTVLDEKSSLEASIRAETDKLEEYESEMNELRVAYQACMVKISETEVKLKRQLKESWAVELSRSKRRRRN